MSSSVFANRAEKETEIVMTFVLHVGPAYPLIAYDIRRIIESNHTIFAT